jgi:hypothetical protein
MSFKDCIRAAVESGRVKNEKGDEAEKAYDRAFNEARSSGMNDRDAADKASMSATERLTKQKGDAKWRRLREMQAAYEVSKALSDAKGLKPWDVPRAMLDGDERYAGANVTTRFERIRGQVHAMIETGLEKYRPRYAGIVHPMKGVDSLVDELYGVSTGDASAKEIAAEMKAATEHLRKRANRAGASIPENKNFRLTQQHDRLQMRRAGRDSWVQQHMDWIDWDLTRHADGSEVLLEERAGYLADAFDKKMTDGYSKIRPGVKTQENLAAQLSHQRFLYYKDAASWRAANKAYGDSDAFRQMVSYFDQMSRDIAMMEVFGPNPGAMQGFINQSVRKRAADMDTASGKGAKDKSNIGKADEALARSDEMYRIFTSQNSMGEESLWGHLFASGRNLLTAAKLGSATLAAIPGDLLTTAHTAKWNKLPVAGFLKQYLRTVNPLSNADRRLAVRSGLVADAATSLATSQQRFLGAISGSQMSRRITDTVLRASLLTPHTQAAQWAWGTEMMGALADNNGRTFDKLPFKDMLERNGIDAADWDIIRSTAIHDENGLRILRPDDVLVRTDVDEREATKVADKFMDMILYERRKAVIEASLEARAMLVSDTRGGTLPGEATRSLAMFKNFPVTIALMLGRRGLVESTYLGKGMYYGSLMLGLTGAGAVAVQMREVAAGRDPLDMTDPRFVGKSMLAGGGLGVFGDFLFSDLNRYGAGLSDMIAGPIFDFLNEGRKLTIGNVQEVLEGKDTNFAREFTAFMTKNAPGSSIWYSKLALQRFVTDRLMSEADPKAHERFRNMESKALKDFNQEYWWAPGEDTARRAPDTGRSFGQ